MKFLTFLIPAVILFLFSVDVIENFKFYIDNGANTVLTSPYGMAILPINVEIPKSLNYFAYLADNTRLFKGDWTLWIYALSPHLATVFIFQLTVFLLFFFSSMRKLEKSYIAFAFALSFHYMAMIDFVTVNYYPGLFYNLSTLINITFIYFFLNLFKQKLESYYWLAIFALCLIGNWFFYPHSYLEERRFEEYAGVSHLITVIFSLYIYFREVKKASSNHVILSIIAIASILSVALPALSFIVAPVFNIKVNLSFNVLFFVPAIFPIVMFVLGMKFGVLRFEVPIFGWFVRLVYFSFFSLVYWFSLGFHIIQFPQDENQITLHLIAGIILLFFIDPLRTISYIYVNRYFYNRRLAFRHYINHAANSVKNPKHIKAFLENFSKTIEDGLGVKSVKVIFARDVFRNWTIETPNVKYLDDDNPLWSQIAFKKKIVEYPSFTQASIGPAKDYLVSQDGFLLMAFQKFKVAVIVSRKLNGEAYLSEDVKYIKSVLRISETLIENYRFLVASVYIKKKEKELELAARIQRRIIPTKFETKHLKMRNYYRPAVKVTGDYIDIFERKRNSHVLFLGDVSGHGLGSSYLMAVTRSMTRGLLIAGNAPLKDVFVALNEFLANSYRGSDFMTLFGMDITIEKRKRKLIASLEYINAGQHPALIYLKDQKKLIKSEKTQRVLGVVSTDYHSDTLVIEEPFRLFAYSDGAFEVFGHQGEMLGEEALIAWIKESVAMSSEEQLTYLKTKIENKAQFIDDMDDLSLMIVDIDL